LVFQGAAGDETGDFVLDAESDVEGVEKDRVCIGVGLEGDSMRWDSEQKERRLAIMTGVWDETGGEM
jgi:hypothetical protein